MVNPETDWWNTRATFDDISSTPTDVCLAAIDAAIPSPPAYPGEWVLDLGCGPGRLTIPMALDRADLAFLGVDASSRMIDAARMSVSGQLPNVQFVVCDGHHIPHSHYSGAWSVLTFQHLPHLVTASYILQVGRWLIPGATFVFQHVLGAADEFLSHQVSSPAVLEQWVVDAGMDVASVDVGAIEEDWVWVTARRP